MRERYHAGDRSRNRPRSVSLESQERRQWNPRIYATGTERCLNLFYKLFRSNCPNKFFSTEFPFFLAVNYQSWRGNSVWYKCLPLGKNNIGILISKAADKASLLESEKQVSNHSVRLDAGLPENFVTQLSDHKNLQSLSS